ncbi:MAG: ketoacyl-ACP synthase III [Anaerolineae bacterium]|nr:ketoacyl-ACP synthase III [Anaerolineae bacterium]
MGPFYGQITGWGMYVPERIITNQELVKRLDSSHEWIVQRTGIHQRHAAAPHETTSTMATQAACRALVKANLNPADLDLIVLGTSTPDHFVAPAPSSQVQHALGATNVPAFTVTTGCTGFVYALTVAHQFIQSGAYRNVLVIGAELLTRLINWQDRATAVLFGDGAGAVVVQATDRPCGLESFVLGSNGALGEHLSFPAGGIKEPLTPASLAEGRQYLQMNGREVFRFASKVMVESCRQVLAQAKVGLAEVDWVIPHQANERIIRAAAREMDIPLDQFIINIDRYANTSAASIPMALCEGLDSGRVQPHHKLLFASFGSGLTWATCLWQM